MEQTQAYFMAHILPLRDALYRLALRIVMDDSEAEDVVQETLLKAWAHRQEWPQIQSIEAWCTTVARRLALDRSEQQKVRRGHLEAGQATIGAQASPTSEPGDSPQGLLERRESLSLIGRLMRTLPERQRQVMHLRDVEGRSYREIADTLGMSEDQVKVNLHRARQRVKQAFLRIEEYRR